LVELTKKYYVEKKARQLADKLDKLSEKQDKRRTKKENSAEKQKALTDFEKFRKNLKI
jgi:DNA-binding transcriptional regulator of glucitol operon